MKERSLRHFLKFKWRFLILFSFALILSSFSAVYFVRYLFKPNTGLVVNYPEVIYDQGEVLFSPKTPFSPAVASGLNPNKDVILEINGRPIKGSRDVVLADAEVWDFDPVEVKVKSRESGERTVYIQPAINPARIDWFFTLIFAIALTFTVFYLIFNLPEDRASNFITLAALFYLVFTCVKPFYYESFFSNLLIHFGKLTSWFMFFFALYFPFPRFKRSIRLTLIWGILGIYLFFIASRLYYYSMWGLSGQESWLVQYRYLGKINNISDGIAYIAYTVLLVSAYIKTPHLSDKRQIEWILAGFLIAIPPYFFLDQLPLIVGGSQGLRMSMGNFASLFLVFVPLFFVIGLIKHRVFNIKYFVNRYIVYGVLFLVILAFFTILYEPVLRLFIANYGLTERVAGFLVTSLLFVFLLPIRTLIGTLVERIFYKAYYSKSLKYSASLEKRNMELLIIVDELNRQQLRTFQTDKIRELRGIITGIAHRINNPVNFIYSGLGSLENRLNTLFKNLKSSEALPREELVKHETEIGRFMSIVEEGSLMIKDFIRKLVSLTGSRSSIMVNVEVMRLVKNSELEMRKRYPQIILELQINSSIKIKCYPAELIQAIEYVLENAVEANQGYEQAISVRLIEEDGAVGIIIEDKGVGIDDLNIKRIFDPFFTTKVDHEGLGLYFAKTIVERNSGQVKISSKSDGGTIVRFLFASKRN